MYDPSKVYELQNKSHVRGVLFKEMHFSEEQELQRKRRQMKQILDQQVQQRKKQKELQKRKQERKIQEEQEQLKAYYMQMEGRQKRINVNTIPQQSNRIGNSGVYESKMSLAEKKNNKINQKYSHGDIPVMPVMQSIERVPSNPSNFVIHPPNNSSHETKPNYNSSAGHIPLLDLGQQQNKKPQKKRLKSKNINKKQQRQRQNKLTVPDDQFSLPGSRQHTDFKEVFGDLNEELESENKELKKELKKNQEAISLLIGAVRSNGKLDKFRVQAQKILYSNMEHYDSRAKRSSTKDERKEKQKDLMLPKLKLKNQSIMHDYIFGSAKKAATLKARTYK